MTTPPRFANSWPQWSRFPECSEYGLSFWQRCERLSLWLGRGRYGGHGFYGAALGDKPIRIQRVPKVGPTPNNRSKLAVQSFSFDAGKEGQSRPPGKRDQMAPTRTPKLSTLPSR